MAQNLLKLFNDNRRAPRNYSIRAQEDTADVYIYDAIGSWYGIDAQQFVKDLAALDAKTINLRINSPGGDVFDARAMATAIRGHGSKIVAHIDGLAASAATYIALAADEVMIAEGGFFMIHNAWTVAMGNAADLRDTAAMLDKVDASIVADYAGKTGKDEQQIRDWMAAETWFSAQEALDNGFVDQIFTGKKADNKWNLAAYSNAPAALTQPAEPVFDRAALERRLQLLERIA